MSLRKMAPVLAAGFAISLFGVSLATGAAAADAHPGHRVYNYAGPVALTPRALPAGNGYRPALQDPLDAWGGNFANPDDNPGFINDNGG